MNLINPLGTHFPTLAEKLDTGEISMWVIILAFCLVISFLVPYLGIAYGRYVFGLWFI